MRDIQSDISLDGLIASTKQYFEYKDRPILKKTRKLSFPELTKTKLGVFIIEIIGGGLASRCIIRKSDLIMLEKKTIAGHEIMIIDSHLRERKGTHTGIWL